MQNEGIYTSVNRLRILGRERPSLVDHQDGSFIRCPDCGKENVRVYYEGGFQRLELHKVWERGEAKGPYTPYTYCIPGPRDEET